MTVADMKFTVALSLPKKQAMSMVGMTLTLKTRAIKYW